MRDGIKIIDFDRHIKEPDSLYQQYLSDSEKKEYLPKIETMGPKNESFSQRLKRLKDYACFPSPEQIMVNDLPLWKDMSEDVTIELNLQSHSRSSDIDVAGDALGQLSVMDSTGVDIAVLLPNHGSYYVYNDDIGAKQSRAYAKAYNRWMIDFMSTSSSRLIGSALISRHDPTCMVKDLEEALKQGFTVVALQSSPVQGVALEDESLYPFWDVCEKNQVTVLFHTFTHSRISIIGSDRFATRFGKFSCSHPMEAMSGILALLTGGVLEKFPDLHFGFLEAGCGWLPYWLWRLDQLSYKSLSNEVAGLIMRPPSEYFKRQIWVAIEPEEVMIPEVIQQIGNSNLIFGSDYPHMDHDSDNIDHVFNLSPSLGNETLNKILWENSADLLGKNFKTSIETAMAV